VVIVPQGPLPPSLTSLDQSIAGALSRCYESRDFSGKKDETSLLYPGGNASRILLVGIGPAEVNRRALLRRAAAVGAKRARQLGVTSVALFPADEAWSSVNPREAGQAFTEGGIQGAWFHSAYKRPPEEPTAPLERIDVIATTHTDAFEAGRRMGAATGAGQWTCRELQVLPGNECTPTAIAAAATDVARRHKLEVTVLDRAAIAKEGMGALLAVAQGSAEEPRFIVLEYKGAKGAPVVLVGKGVSFDSGGISIKPAERMEDMKFDMSGAAAVVGTFEMLGRLRPALHVVGLIPSAENMPSGTAMRPGDVLRSHLGKSIEVVNTDAEGRLLLADALSYARRFSPACVVDIATLTGAITIGLGQVAAGVMGTDPALIQALIAAGERSHERLWELPLWDDYRDLNKSEIADVKNSGGRPAGSISAGWFLREFVDGYPWAHLDIAGTAYTDREDAAMVKGPTGMGVRLFSEFLLARA
jgi:leucyl aminopeptidase